MNISIEMNETALERERAIAIRNAHFTHEGIIKAIGFMNLFFGILTLITLGTMMVGIERATLGIAVAVTLLLSIPQILIGYGLIKLHLWARNIAGVLYAISLLAFPIGTVIGGAILYVLFSYEGKMIFSSEYREVIKHEPHRKHIQSTFIKILIWSFLILFSWIIIEIMVDAVTAATG